MKDFKEKLALVPNKPGSYQMYNKDGLIIYVGKAKNLKNRLKSYFTGNQTGKTRLLVEEIEEFKYIVTKTELESLILEITLIKKYDPKYNILLKDDKTYPYIELTNELYPKLRIARNVKRKKTTSHLYGPYPNVSSAREVVNMLNRIYPLRKCEKLPKEVCLYYHISECLGYCAKEIDKDVISNMKKDITKFLKGDYSKVVADITTKMNNFSNNLNFEKALEYKNMLNHINETLKKQIIDLGNNYNLDIINYYKKDNYLSIEIFFIRDGLLFGTNNDIIGVINEQEDLEEYIIKFYEKNVILPKEILINENANKNLLQEYFNIKISTPQKGKLKRLLDLAQENAKEKLEEKIEIVKQNDDIREKSLNELKKLLNINSVSRMESFDNSHLFTTFYVGAMVVYEDFIPQKKEYRKYKIDSKVQDDLAAMKEVLYRRYYKVIMEDLKKPDLIVMDGGKLQISIAKEILDSLNLAIPVIGLVKDKNHKTSYIMNDKYEILDVKKNSNLFIFLTKIQEEVHRYAITYHRNISSKGALASVLELIPKIGTKRRKDLLKKFRSLKAIKEASIEELSEVLDEKLAISTYNYLKELENKNNENQ